MRMRLRRDKLTIVYDHVPFVINSSYAQNSGGLFGPSGADHKKAQDGCQNGQLWLSAFIRMTSTESQPGDEKGTPVTDYKKYTRPMALCVGAALSGRPAVRFNHSLF